ncbi:hypothetical protein PPL_05054 [Heterostelium album PN500]|uniref:Uncharacterized protein n=1 Tax=Heterostelium pallidum (strain ATCC 26659 / Pp 5 / PN500) TaxID=670386 RepID=D3B9B0_HETP5|nr:hypothetical protein PPL_05054 [Heterostelium album PN500]EFA81822.1 hypothetical protein PPL_05054 [Heterostelium album PN500]|eukprot:XP_020433939.1 hypothetical protein PPL_05054 [Heterostelium album PN500]
MTQHGSESDTQRDAEVPQNTLQAGAVYQSDTIEILHEARIDNALTKTNKPDLIVKNRTKKSIKIIEKSVPYDNNIVKRDRDKIEKYQPLAAALKKSNPDHNVAVIPIIIGAFGTYNTDNQRRSTYCPPPTLLSKAARHQRPLLHFK